MTLRDAASGLCTEAGQELASPGSSICNSATFLPLHRLCHSLCSPSPLLTRLLSLGSGVTIPVSSQPRQQSPRGATMVHMFWYVLHVALDKAWCPPGAAGDEPDTGLGLLQNLPLSHKAESTACPQLPGGKRGWYPMTSLNQHPPVSSELLPIGGEKMRSRTSHALPL